MSPKQRDFIVSLASERQLPEDEKGTYVLSLVAGTAREPNPAQASAIIEWLLALPRKAAAGRSTCPLAATHSSTRSARSSSSSWWTGPRAATGRGAPSSTSRPRTTSTPSAARGRRRCSPASRWIHRPRCSATAPNWAAAATAVGRSPTRSPAPWASARTARRTSASSGSPRRRRSLERRARPHAPRRADGSEAAVDAGCSSSTDKQGVPHAVGGWKARKAYASAQLRGEARTVKPAVLTIIEELPGETWEDIFGGAA